MKNLNQISLTLTLMFLALGSYAQLSKTNPNYKRGYNWVFGQGVGLNFETYPPTAFGNLPFNQTEGTGCISDSDGNLQFYTDGYHVFNKYNKQIKNGKGLMGDHSSTQSALIVNHVENDSLFYIFTTPQFQNTGGSFYVNVLNTYNDTGKGEIIIKNHKLMPLSTEKLTSTNHQNGKDIWILAHGLLTNTYNTFLLTNDGLIECPVKSKVGNIKDVASPLYDINGVGYLRFSNEGGLIASVIPISKRIELFSFNKQNGLLKEKYNLNYQYQPYGLSFSNSGNRLFIQSRINFDSTFIDYFNLETETLHSVYRTNAFDDIQAIQTTKNNELYIAFNADTSLGLVQNLDGTPKYISAGVNLGGQQSSYGMPNFNQSYSHTPSIDFVYHMNCHENSAVFEGKDSFYATSYKWYFKNIRTKEKDSSTMQETNYIFPDTGTYQVTYIAIKVGRSDTVIKDIVIYPKIEKSFLGKDTFYCKGDVFTHTLKVAKGLHCWNWGMDKTEGIIGYSLDSTFTLDTAGIYISTIVTKNFCVSRDTIEVLEHEAIKPTIYHNWDSLYCDQEYISYQWYRDGKEMLGEIQDRISMKNTGNYELIGTDIYGCSARSKVIFIASLSTNLVKNENIHIYPIPMKDKLNIELKGEYNINLYNALGNLILTKSLKNKAILNIEDLPKGLYLLTITKDKKTIKTKKIIKK